MQKKGKLITIKKGEGHGRLDGTRIGVELSRIQLCRFHFPGFPLDQTTLVVGLSKDTDEETLKKKKQDLKKIVSYLIRQSNGSETLIKLKSMTFDEFLYNVGMFKDAISFSITDNIMAKKNI